MFEKIVLRRSETGPNLTAGELAEALLFYQNVYLVLDFSSLSEMVKQIGMSRLLALLSEKNVSAVFCDETLGTRTQGSGVAQYHDFVAITLSSTEAGGKILSTKGRVEAALLRNGHEKRVAARLAEAFQRQVPTRKLQSDYFVPGGVVKAATNDLDDPAFVHEAVRRVLEHYVGSDFPLGNFAFEIFKAESGFHIYSDLNLESITNASKTRNSNEDAITLPRLVNEILMARADTVLAAHYGGDFYTANMSSQIIRLRYGELFRRMGIDSAQLREFKEIVIPEARSVREAIDSGEKSFDEFVLLLEKSQKFRDWIQGVNPDEKLVKAYLQDVTAEGWIQGLPSKTLRYVLSSVVGFVEPITGLAASAADTFLVEKIFGGWRPSHFVKGQLKAFVESSGK
jgi:hypothetical protein